MVNAPTTPKAEAPSQERRASPRADVLGAGVLGAAKLHPFGDLHALQHLSVRLARGVRAAIEPFARSETRAWAEPLEVMSWGDYRARRPDRLTAWQPFAMDDRHCVVAAIDGTFTYELLDLFFGGPGEAPHSLPTEFSPAADALLGRIAQALAGALRQAWEPLARAGFRAERCETGAAMVPGVEPDEIVVVTRFGVARGTAGTVHLDIVYPVAALKPHTNVLTGKVVAKTETGSLWQTQLTRAAMSVRLPVRSVLAEPRVSIARLMALQPGDVIPISFAPDVPVMVGGAVVGTATVGTSNGRAAIRISKLEGPVE